MMQTATKSFSILKAFNYIFAVIGIFSFVVIPILHSVIFGFQTGNWKPSIDSSLGLMFNTEKNLQDDINILLSPLSNNYPRKFIDHIKSDIVFNILFNIHYLSNYNPKQRNYLRQLHVQFVYKV